MTRRSGASEAGSDAAGPGTLAARTRASAATTPRILSPRRSRVASALLPPGLSVTIARPRLAVLLRVPRTPCRPRVRSQRLARRWRWRLHSPPSTNGRRRPAIDVEERRVEPPDAPEARRERDLGHRHRGLVDEPLRSLHTHRRRH